MATRQQCSPPTSCYLAGTFRLPHVSTAVDSVLCAVQTLRRFLNDAIDAPCYFIQSQALMVDFRRQLVTLLGNDCALLEVNARTVKFHSVQPSMWYIRNTHSSLLIMLNRLLFGAGFYLCLTAEFMYSPAPFFRFIVLWRFCMAAFFGVFFISSLLSLIQVFTKRASSIIPSGTAIYTHPELRVLQTLLDRHFSTYLPRSSRVTQSVDYEGELGLSFGSMGGA
ncbi:hypothetical protein C8J57DRAFT_1730705 [Mycena rebaudengoi]|nr:hypothetical protein C8J57DRAFT_1730705 [Mycena rebaudengoi]